MVGMLLEYAGQKIRGSDLFGQETPIAMTKKFLKGLKVHRRFFKVSTTQWRNFESFVFKQGGHGTGKTGKQEIYCNTGKIFENIFDCIYYLSIYYHIWNFQQYFCSCSVFVSHIYYKYH